MNGVKAMPCRRLVVKLGTNLLTAGGDRLDLDMMATLVGQVARLHKHCHLVAPKAKAAPLY